MEMDVGARLTWKQLEGYLSGRPGQPPLVPVNHLGDAADRAAAAVARVPGSGEGHRQGKERHVAVPFAELNAVSSYNFLGGASDPEEMVARAVELGLDAIALLDRDGLYGVVKFSEAAKRAGIATVFGAELTVEPDMRPLPVLARSPEGYRRLSRVISRARMLTGTKGEVDYGGLTGLEELRGECVALVPHEWVDRLDEVIDLFGSEGVALMYEATMSPEDADHHALLDAARGDAARGSATRGDAELRAVISSSPGAATRDEALLAGAKRALGRRQAWAQAAPDLHPMGAPWLRSGKQILAMAPGREAEVAATVELARDCSFDLQLVAPNLPGFKTPEGFDEMSWLEELTWSRGRVRYASRPPEVWEKAVRQIEHELRVIKELGFPGYFLIVNDFVDFCRRSNILCQGRGSAANSAVCFALGITNVDPVSAGLLFERFLSPDRDGPPDIDIDIESGRREEVIQYVYDKHGRERAAQVANVITYRTKGAIRDAARALGYPQGAADGWSKGIEQPPADVEELAAQFVGQPRHLGIHSGGMVLCDRPIADVVPVEWARMEARSVIQWDKDDAAAGGLVKFDMLGLGMLGALHHMIDLVKEQHGRTVNLWELDLADPAVYEMLSRADAVGVFQVESRAQMNTLPRLKPREFYDLVVEVALIRPGPIQGGSVHPYLRRRTGEEPVEFEHPVLEHSLGKTLGVPLFQEQIMQMAVDAAGFSGGEADNLRRAMGSKRSPEKMAALKQRFLDGLRSTSGIEAELAEHLWTKVVAFAAYGFPESHSQSFASLVYFSAWFKRYYPAEFCVGLLRAQPMGFYSPQSLIQDARRHGVKVRPVDVQHSGLESAVEDGCIRVGLNLVKGLGDAAGQRIEDARLGDGPFADIPDLARRADLSVSHVEALARAGALDGFGVGRRQAMWQAGVAATERQGMLPGMSAISAPALPGMNAFELMAADVLATGVTHDKQPVEMIRDYLDGLGVVPASALRGIPDGTRVRIAGVVTHRQAPKTAGGVTFFGMEDETGLMNIIVPKGLWERQKVLARTAKALIVRGTVQNQSEATSFLADKFEPLEVAVLSVGSRDFR